MFKRWLLLVISSFAVVALSACQLPGTALPEDGPAIEVSEEAAASFEQKVAQAAGAGTLTVTQQEVTSYFALRLADPQMPVRNPQIYFQDDGQIVLRGELNFQQQFQPFRVVGEPSVVDGNVKVDLTEGKVGPIPVPGAILNQLETYLAQAIVAGENYAHVNEIQVNAGSLTVNAGPPQ